jgi:hypothetical protein
MIKLLFYLYQQLNCYNLHHIQNQEHQYWFYDHQGLINHNYLLLILKIIQY